MKNDTKVVVTGMGVITPIGNTIEEFWDNLRNGRGGVDHITRFDTSGFPVRIAAEVKGFQAKDYMDQGDARRMDPFCQYAVAAAKMAIEDSALRLDEEDRDRVGVIVGSGIGGILSFEEQHSLLLKRGPRRISPLFIPMLISDIAAGHISMIHGLRGPNYSVASACATGGHAIGAAMRTIQNGEADVVVAGGTEAVISPMAVGGFAAMRALSVRNDEPEKASRPFDKERDGFIVGEGAGIVVLESEPHAKKRGARIHAEMIGLGFTADAHHITAPAPEGAGAQKAMRLAIDDAGIQPEEVDYINAHGTSTEYNDKIETVAIKKVFGDYAYKLAISSTKSMTGHLLGAAGSVEVIVSILAVQHDTIPPTINYEYPDPECDLNYIPNTAEKRSVNLALSNTFGFGGHNASLIIKRYK